MPLRCVYTDLDGTLLGRAGSLFRDAEGNFSLAQARTLEACHRAGVEVVLMSCRREAQVMADARLIGQTTYEGTVTAASDWGGPAEIKRVRPGLPGSYEALFHRAGHGDFLLRIEDLPSGGGAWLLERLSP